MILLPSCVYGRECQVCIPQEAERDAGKASASTSRFQLAPGYTRTERLSHNTGFTLDV